MDSALRSFDVLGERLERDWSKKGYDERVFPKLAYTHLTQSNPSRWARPEGILRHFLRAPTLPEQHAINFGSPALVVYNGRHFLIEVLFWATGSVAIHQHGFSGAFHVLSGSSVHCSFVFKPIREVNSRFLLGQLTRNSTEVLETGETRPIHAAALIHSLFHLDQPSVTVVVRTRNESRALPQYAYEPPHVAIDPFYNDRIGRRRLEALSLLREVKSKACRAAFGDYVTKGDLQMCYEGLKGALGDEELFEDLLASARRAHGALVDYLPPVFEQMQRRDLLIARRKHITDAGHRFFLGLLLNLDTRKQILQHVGARFPGSPISTVMRWVRELSTHAAPDDPVFGLDLSDAESDIFECLLRGKTLPQVLRELARDYGAAEVRAMRSDIERFHGALRHNQVYNVLFQS